jgi:hypothetical protein
MKRTMTSKLTQQWLPILTLLIAAGIGRAQTNLIDFDDGVTNAPIDAFYASRGVVMSNAIWSPNVDVHGTPFNGCSGQFVLFAQVGGTAPTSQTPLVATFGIPLRFVAISASDVGVAGARLEAYDAEVGGNLIGSAQAIGTGVGFDIYRELEVAAIGIRRIHLFQPQPNGSDGVVWDNLRFAPAVPGSVGLHMYAGLQVQGCPGCRYRIECADGLQSTNWITLANITLPSSPFLWFDLASPTEPRRFYRAVLE